MNLSFQRASKLFFGIILCLLLALSSSANGLDVNNFNQPEVISQSVPSNLRNIGLDTYTTAQPIVISSNAEFDQLAIDRGWTGDGSQGSPYLITNLNITYQSSGQTSGIPTMIDISNTCLFCSL